MVEGVKGRCPACGKAALFLAADGYVTCSISDCPDPAAPDALLHGWSDLEGRHRALTVGLVGEEHRQRYLRSPHFKAAVDALR